MSWKIEKKSLNGLEAYVIVSSNGAMRHATTEEVDLWTDLMKKTAIIEEMLTLFNKLGLKCEDMVKTHKGRGLKPETSSSSSSSSSSKSALSSSGASTSSGSSSSSSSSKKDTVSSTSSPHSSSSSASSSGSSSPAAVGSATPGSDFRSGFGKRDSSISADIARKYFKKLGKWPSTYTPTDEDKSWLKS